jgi:methylmalonyl-CoA/ethylmalonyl-CoA epimerase
MGYKFDHVGIVVKDLEKSLRAYEELLGLKVKHIEDLDVEGAMIRIAFLQIGDVNVEVVQTDAKTGLVGEWLRDHGEGIYHFAFEVEDIDKTFAEFSSRGAKFIWGKIIPGSRGSRIAVLEGQAFNGVLIEILQKKH